MAWTMLRLHAVLTSLHICSAGEYGSVMYLTRYTAPGRDNNWLTHSSFLQTSNIENLLDQTMGKDAAGPYFKLDLHVPRPNSECWRSELSTQASPTLLNRISAMAGSINLTGHPPSLKTDDATATARVRIFPRRANPWANPHSARHFVGPPPRSFGNKTQFVSYRGEAWGGTTSGLLDAIEALDLGKAIYPELPFIWQQNATAVLRDIKSRGMFLVNLNSYFMGAATDCRTRYPQGGGVCQFRVSHEDLWMLEQTTGDHFAGFEIGEKDGGMLGLAAGYTAHGNTGHNHILRSVQRDAAASARRDEWLRFRHTFELMGEDLGFQLSALVSAYFPHYLAKSGYYIMLGAETAEMLPNDQIFYAFVRGAAKQYGTLTYGMASVWNHYAGKDCRTSSACTETGSSLSLLRRLMVTEILYGSSWFAFECCMYITPPANATDHTLVLTPLGRISRSGKKLVDRLPVLGSTLTTVGVMMDFYTGFAPPRTAYADYTQGNTYWNAGDLWRAWGPLPADSGDFFTTAVLNITYPGWVNSQYFQDERGFLCATPFGDIVDILLSDAPASLLEQYHMLVVTTTIRTMKMEVRSKLEDYIRGGGTGVVTAEAIESMGGIFGILASRHVALATMRAGSTVNVSTTLLPGLPGTITEPNEFEIWSIDYRLAGGDVTIVVAASMHTGSDSSQSIPLIYKVSAGPGTLWILASNGVCTQSSAGPTLVSEMDESLENPRPVLVHVRLALERWLSAAVSFTAGPNLSVVTTAIEGLPNEYIVGIGNPSLSQVDLNLTCGLGKIAKIEEILLDPDNTVGPHTPGYFPTGFNGSDIGNSTPTTIAGLDQRVFRIVVNGSNTQVLPIHEPVPLPTRRGLPLAIKSGIADEVSNQPSFFDHWDTVVVDWRWVFNQDTDALARDGQWSLRQKLSIIVDFTSGLNGWPDLRLWNNSQTELSKTIDTVTAVLQKMGTVQNASVAGKRTGAFARHGIISLHAYPPTTEVESIAQAHNDMISAVARLVCIAHGFNVTLHLRVGATTASEYTRPPISVESALEFVQNVSSKVSFLCSDGVAQSSAETPKLMLLVSAAQLAVQGYNASTLPSKLIPHIGGWEFATPVFDDYGGALVSVHGPLAVSASQSTQHSRDPTGCVFAPNMTWRTMPFGLNSGASVAREPADCCALCHAQPTCGVATWSGADGVCYMAQGLITRLVPIDACKTPSTELAPGVDVIHDCPWKPPLHGTTAVRPLRLPSYYYAAIRDLARLARPGGDRVASTYVIAGGIEPMMDSNVHIDASFLEARAMTELGL